MRLHRESRCPNAGEMPFDPADDPEKAKLCCKASVIDPLDYMTLEDVNTVRAADYEDNPCAVYETIGLKELGPIKRNFGVVGPRAKKDVRRGVSTGMTGMTRLDFNGEAEIYKDI